MSGPRDPKLKTRAELEEEVHELRETLSRARQGQGAFRSLLMDKVTDSVHVHDAEGNTIYVNEAACTSKGYSRDELLRLPLQRMVTPEFADLVDARLKRILEQGRAAFESSHLHKDGTAIPVEVRASVLEAGGERLVVSVVRDLSERAQARADLQRSEEQYRQLFESLQDVFYRTDTEGRAVLFSPSVAAVFGYKPDEVLGDDLAQTFYHDPSERPAFLERLQQDGQVLDHRTRCKNRAGDEVWVSTNARYYRDHAGEVLGVEGITRDITSQVKAERQLERTMETLKRSNRDLEQFAYVASHDLQEPLRMISGFVQLLDKNFRGKMDNTADEYLDFIVESTKRMQQQIQDLLTYSRVGREGRTFRTVHCDRVLDRVVDNLRLAVKESKAKITREPLPRVFADESQILMLYQNIIYNAIKYRGENKPRIHVGCTLDDDGQHHVSIKDNGLGIDPRFHDRIFQIFQRLHPREEYSGTGIGLALCKRIVENHGGRIWVKSAEGEGSTFHFTLPGSRR